MKTLLIVYLIGGMGLTACSQSTVLDPGHLSFEKFMNQNFEGKRVFVDLWATWCGPCKMEFRNYDSAYYAFMKENKLELLYLSVDKDEQEKLWEKDVSELSLNGYHVRANDKIMMWIHNNVYHHPSKIAVPWYLVFDENGKMVANGFERPSSKDFKEKIKSTFNTN